VQSLISDLDLCDYYKLVSVFFLKSSVIAISTGIRISVIKLAKISPKAKEIATGIRYWVCSEVSDRSGVNPATVVAVVRKIA
jgi:hypothetical protein